MHELLFEVNNLIKKIKIKVEINLVSSDVSKLNISFEYVICSLLIGSIHFEKVGSNF